jgi:cytochrome c biogenesis protein CcmG/thiol:disulfide interchange protein DsbE
MQMRFAIPLALLATLLVLFAVGLQHDPREIPSPLIGKPAPAFDLPIYGAAPARMTAQQLHGAPVLVNFFASWCVECQVEHPFLMQLGQAGAVNLVGIDYKDDEGDLREWLQRRGDPYGRILEDTTGMVGIDWGVYGVPETFVLDADGRIVYKQIGAVTPEVWQQKIAPLIAAKSSGPRAGA